MQFVLSKSFRSVAFATMLSGVVNPVFAQEIIETQKVRLKVETIASGLKRPWGLAFLPDGALLVTERAGAMRLVENGKVSRPISGLPRIAAGGQGGLLDVVLDPDFKTTSRIFFTFSEPGRGGSGTAVASARLLREGKPRLRNVNIIFSINKKSRSRIQFGSRIVFAPDKTMYVTIGDRGDDDRAQDPMDHAGSIIRINRDGSIPADNPYADGKKALPELWSIGHRNPQGAAIHPKTGKLWTVEHGARGGDEINRPEAGKNYGWPVISYGRYYSGFKIGVGTKAPGMEQPIHYWDPSIAPSGLAFYNGKLMPKWQGDLFVGALKYKLLVRLEIDNGRVINEEQLLQNRYGRIRDVRSGPDGALWLLTDERNGKILRLTPAG